MTVIGPVCEFISLNEVCGVAVYLWRKGCEAAARNTWRPLLLGLSGDGAAGLDLVQQLNSGAQAAAAAAANVLDALTGG